MKPLTVSLSLLFLCAGGLAQAQDAASPSIASRASALHEPSDPSPSGYHYAPDAVRPPPPAVDDDAPSSSSNWLLRGGMVVGKGFTAAACKGSACGPDVPEENFTEKPGAYLGLDFLYNTSRTFRFGVGLNVVPERVLVDENGDRFELGTQMGLSFLLEPVLPLSDKISLAFRGQAGTILLWPSGALDDAAQDNDRYCVDHGSELTSCDAEVPPFGGGEAALGIGLRVEASNTVWRADLQAQGFILRTLGMDVAGPGGTAETVLEFQGMRGVLTAGVEL